MPRDLPAARVESAQELCDDIKKVVPHQHVAFVCNYRVAIESDCPDEIIRARRLQDDPATLEATLRSACEAADAIVTSGGVSVGEGLELLKQVVGYTTPYLPEDKPRYLMGVGLPEDILESVERGIDMFDCVIPTRYARSATLFTNRGRIRLTNKNYRRDFSPVEPNCSCYTCRNFTRAYLHHLFTANEVLSAILASIHNVHFYLNMMAEVRESIEQGRFKAYKEEFLASYLKSK